MNLFYYLYNSSRNARYIDVYYIRWLSILSFSRKRRKEWKALIFPITKTVLIKARNRNSVLFFRQLKGWTHLSFPLDLRTSFSLNEHNWNDYFSIFLSSFFRLLFPSSTSSTALNILLQHFLFAILTKHLWTVCAMPLNGTFLRTTNSAKRHVGLSCSFHLFGESFVHLPLKRTAVSSSCLGNSMKSSTGVRGTAELCPLPPLPALLGSKQLISTTRSTVERLPNYHWRRFVSNFLSIQRAANHRVFG